MRSDASQLDVDTALKFFFFLAQAMTSMTTSQFFFQHTTTLVDQLNRHWRAALLWLRCPLEDIVR